MVDEADDPTEADTGPNAYRPPAEAFASLGNQLRIDILYTLWEAHDPPGPTPLSFSALQERTDASDSGNFNYHLDTLVGTFVKRATDGYVLRTAGQQVVRSVLSGTNTENPTVGPAEIDETCPVCEATLTLDYHDGAVRIRCPACASFFPGDEYPEGTIGIWPLSPAGVGPRTPEEMLNAAFTQWVVNLWSMIGGVCPACSDVPVVSIHRCEDHDPDENGICPTCGVPVPTVTHYVCENCKFYIQTGPRGTVLFRPAVIAFLYNHGVDITLTSTQYHMRVFECGEEVVSSDPLRIEVTVPAGDDELCVTLDKEMSVVAVAESPSPH